MPHCAGGPLERTTAGSSKMSDANGENKVRGAHFNRTEKRGINQHLEVTADSGQVAFSTAIHGDATYSPSSSASGANKRLDAPFPAVIGRGGRDDSGAVGGVASVGARNICSVARLRESKYGCMRHSLAEGRSRGFRLSILCEIREAK